ncbi:MAG: hypothetical protein A3K65_04960 [Euryarchaeota archaeon RBG_16_68_12]|nr:MAG: hypothetical protein A3K65_04960 [Euryarchaeota archaeon RBG_16_68_12]
MRRGFWSWVAVALLVLTGFPAALPFLAPGARALTPHAPISIVGNAGFTSVNVHVRFPVAREPAQDEKPFPIPPSGEVAVIRHYM